MRVLNEDLQDEIQKVSDYMEWREYSQDQSQENKPINQPNRGIPPKSSFKATSDKFFGKAAQPSNLLFL